MTQLTNHQTYNISNKLCTQLPKLLTGLNIEYVEYPNRYSFACPIHGGDSPEGCSIFVDGHSSKGNWRCWTRQCEIEFTSGLFGFVRGALSTQQNKSVSIDETAEYCQKLLNINLDDLDDEYYPRDHNLKLLEIFDKHPSDTNNDINRDDVRGRLQIPATYYINRGFLPETLDLFDVGLCEEKNLPMSGRIVVPIYDEGYNYVGCVGRAVRNGTTPKWLHSKGFKKSFLYGFCVAKTYIEKTQTVILVEGQGDVWRMPEAGHKNCVGIFGSSLTEDQLILLEHSGALNIVILTDYDEAGEKAAKQIEQKCGRRFNYYRPQLSSKDVGDMAVDNIHQELNPQLEKVK